ncbi:uncharacterized protein LOC133512554 [Syngnathoides biaculeatus]|uniref:uncharacterized protein LOC133512554 n=1 Tax=Syngnathoides biaculeatus TaxID=300417 RepID=UPI002ADDDEAE|nr:uncharacterized protein LOC133512554 [Syngnathoides biaculeatus]
MEEVLLTSVESVLSMCTEVYRMVRTAKSNKALCQQVGERVRSLEKVVLSIKRRPDNASPDVRDALVDLSRTLTDAAEFMGKLSKANKVLRVIKSGSNESKLQEVGKNLSEGVQLLSVALQISHGDTLRDCLEAVVSENRATEDGGGAAGGPARRSVVSENRATEDGGGAAGGPARRSVVSENRATEDGGGAAGGPARPSVVSENRATEDGGGAAGGPARPSVVAENRATEDGGRAAGGPARPSPVFTFPGGVAPPPHLMVLHPVYQAPTKTVTSTVISSNRVPSQAALRQVRALLRQQQPTFAAGSFVTNTYFM